MSRVAEDKSISKMGKTTCCPTGPNILGINVVAINGVGNGKGCDHGKSRFVIDTVLSDMRLIGRIPPEKVREKFEAVNEGFGKCTNHSAWFLVIYIPMCIAGVFFFLSGKRIPKVRCTNTTQVCSGVERNAEYDLSTCNNFWCCPIDPGEDAESSNDFIEANCVALSGDERLGGPHSEETVAELCQEKQEMTHCKCKKEGGGCGVTRIEGEKGNFEQEYFVSSQQRTQSQLLGQAGVQGGWILAYCFFFYRTSVQKRFLKESFKDWKMIYGVETKYETKWYVPWYPGMLYLILPQSFQTAPQHTI